MYNEKASVMLLFWLISKHEIWHISSFLAQHQFSEGALWALVVTTPSSPPREQADR